MICWICQTPIKRTELAWLKGEPVHEDCAEDPGYRGT